MTPPPGERLRRFVGDRLAFTLGPRDGETSRAGWRARLRTDLGRDELLCREIIHAHAKKIPAAGASWHDLPMQPDDGEGTHWRLELPLVEPGYFKAKAYLIDPQGWQIWPTGTDLGISVHPNHCRTGNTIYCAFTRMFGPNRTRITTADPKQDAAFKEWDKQDYTIIPPSGKFRDLIQQLPHIVDRLGCRILHLLPVNPTPTTYARFGRFGSPYASEDLTAVDPALVVFDKRTTGIDQFRELAYATHLHGARLFLDIVINHTGWGSHLQETHPEWFLREGNGEFASPGAWGTTWEDLVELKHDSVKLWDHLAEVFLTWCRRGVDGFRCDAGYKVPLPAWQYITAHVRQEFPSTVFLLEGLGGAWTTTDELLTEGGMQWAYSELFQNYSATEIAHYLDYSLRQSQRTGLLVHYSETHDNTRLAEKGRVWSLLRNRLCALASVSGGYGFTCGVEWLAPERVNVHSSRGLAWDNPDNIVPELAVLNRLLNDHPCFFEGAKVARLSATESPVLILRRDSEEGKDSLLVLANNDCVHAQTVALDPKALADMGALKYELTGQKMPATLTVNTTLEEFKLEPGACVCLSAYAEPQGLAGDDYRRAREQAAWAMTALKSFLPIQFFPLWNWRDLARVVHHQPGAWLGAITETDPQTIVKNLEQLLNAPEAGESAYYQPVVHWSRADCPRIVPVPPAHWLLIEDTVRFRAILELSDGTAAQTMEAIEVEKGFVAGFSPRGIPGKATVKLERYTTDMRQVTGELLYLAAQPKVTPERLALNSAQLAQWREELAQARQSNQPIAQAILEQPLALLTNGRGGMARLCMDFGAIKSKYDCLLGANLHPTLPVDRHVLAKRARLWVNADGFITALNLQNLVHFQPGPPAVWDFIANAGDGRTVEIKVTAAMPDGFNTTLLQFSRPTASAATGKSLPAEADVRLTVRVDIEDRSFHAETKRNGGAEYHFNANTQTSAGQIGFLFAPALDRQLRVFTDSGLYHPAVEWSENIPHPVEQSRGQTASGDAVSPGWFELPLAKGGTVLMVLSADAEVPPAKNISEALAADGTTESKPAPDIFAAENAFGRQLQSAAQAYVVRRDAGVTVIAGYPWFLDWGRDSLICARGLLAAGMTEQVTQLLLTFGKFEQNGTLPNTIHGADASNRDTSDAPLWYGIVCEELAARIGPQLYQMPVEKGGRTILQVLSSLAANYYSGTPNGIHADKDSGLIWSPSHFTWMDTNYPAGTPRAGYPVEIQALWIRLLRQLERVAPPNEQTRWRDLAVQAETSFNQYFWMEARGYAADLLSAPNGQPAAGATVDNSLRSNCLLAVSLGLLKGKNARRCVAAAARYLLVPGALRTLAPLPVSPLLPIYNPQGGLLNNPAEPYWGHYEGDEDTRRKPAYHNGTAWTWTFPIFCEALAAAWPNDKSAHAAARAYLGSMNALLNRGCIGQLPEIMDGDTPHTQRGCDAQAWGVTEALRVWRLLQ